MSRMTCLIIFSGSSALSIRSLRLARTRVETRSSNAIGDSLRSVLSSRFSVLSSRFSVLGLLSAISFQPSARSPSLKARGMFPRLALRTCFAAKRCTGRDPYEDSSDEPDSEVRRKNRGQGPDCDSNHDAEAQMLRLARFRRHNPNPYVPVGGSKPVCQSRIQVESA